MLVSLTIPFKYPLLPTPTGYCFIKVARPSAGAGANRALSVYLRLTRHGQMMLIVLIKLDECSSTFTALSHVVLCRCQRRYHPPSKEIRKNVVC